MRIIAFLLALLLAPCAYGQTLTARLVGQVAAGSCVFTRSTNASIAPSGWKFGQRGGVPTSDTEDCPAWPYFPQNYATTDNLAKLVTSTQTLIPTYANFWAWADTDSCVVVSCTPASLKQKPGSIVGAGTTGCRLRYGSPTGAYTLATVAIAATESNASYAYGFPQTGGLFGWQDIVTNVGVPTRDVLTYAQWTAEPTTFCSPVIAATASGKTMTVSSISSGAFLAINDVITGLGGQQTITAFVSATDAYAASCVPGCRGTSGTYTISPGVASTASCSACQRSFQGYQTAPVDTVVELTGCANQAASGCPTISTPFWGDSCDCEAADGRSCTQMTAMVTEFGSMAAAATGGPYKTELRTNRIDSGSSTGLQNGFCPQGNAGYNIDTIASHITDWVIASSGTVSAWNANAAEFITTPLSKIGILISGNWNPTNAKEIYCIGTYGNTGCTGSPLNPTYWGVEVHLQGANPGGTCTSNKNYVQLIEATSGVNVGC